MVKILIDDPIITTHPTLPDNWIVMKDFPYKKHDIDILIPKGFVTDLASVPKFLWSVIAPFELSTTAPIVHDWCYRKGLKTRAEIDQLFFDIMTDEHISHIRRSTAYYGVRAFGWSSYNSGKVIIEEIEEV